MSLFSLRNKSVWLVVLGAGLPLHAQVNTGELRLHLADPAGLGLAASVTISSAASQYRKSFTANATGDIDVKSLPYGIYLVRSEDAGFAPRVMTIDVRSSAPTVHTITLAVAAVATSVDVSGQAPLIDPYRPFGDADWVGTDTGSGRLFAGPVGAGPCELAAGLAVRGECCLASARIGVSDAVCH